MARQRRRRRTLAEGMLWPSSLVWASLLHCQGRAAAAVATPTAAASEGCEPRTVNAGCRCCQARKRHEPSRKRMRGTSRARIATGAGAAITGRLRMPFSEEVSSDMFFERRTRCSFAHSCLRINIDRHDRDDTLQVNRACADRLFNRRRAGRRSMVAT